jgi:hypothetical protein
MCTYHGWTYDLKGALVGVPGFKEVYHEELAGENWGLIKAAQVDSYKGFVFATMDPEAPALNEYLNDAGRYPLDLLADQGEMVAFGGVLKYSMNVNWKFPTDNTADFYHAALTHASSFMAGWSGKRFNRLNRLNRGKDGKGVQRLGYGLLGDYGHVAGISFLGEGWEQVVENDPAEHWRLDPEVQKRLGTLKSRSATCAANIFPNIILFPLTVRQIAIRMPKGPSRSEIWYFTFVDSKANPGMKDEHRVRANHTFGPSGFLEQDDGENWEQSHRGAQGVVTGRHPLNYQMGLGHAEIVDDEFDLPRIDGQVNEHYMLWQHRVWQEFMLADSWAALKMNHSTLTDLV